MTHQEEELKKLREEIIEIWQLVSDQLKKSLAAFVKMDKELASEVLITEKRVNAMEVKIDRDCENFFALFNPVAVDLRFVLAVLKINTNIERIGDIAAGIAKFVTRSNAQGISIIIERTRTLEMFEEACDLVDDTLNAFESENGQLARGVFKRDELLDEINRSATGSIATIIRENPDHIEYCLNLLSAIRKLERAGDQCKNIAEEIIFYIEAKVLKHTPKDQKRPDAPSPFSESNPTN